MKKRYKLGTILLASALILSACGGGGKDTTSEASDKQVLRVIESTEIPLMDTTLATDGVSFTAMNQVFEGLYTLDKNDRIIPAAASAMPKISEDQKTYTIQIRDNAKWSDGSELTANDFIYAWRKVVDPTSGAQYSFLYRDIVQNASEILDGKKRPNRTRRQSTGRQNAPNQPNASSTVLQFTPNIRSILPAKRKLREKRRQRLCERF